MGWVQKTLKSNKSVLFGSVLVIFLATLIVYGPAFDGEWIWDDDATIYENPVVTQQEGIQRIWLSTEDYDYWPMTKTVLWTMYRFFEDDPAGYHIVNILFHALAAILIYLSLRRLSMPGAWLAGMVFALHPVNASSVVWVSEIKNTLSMIFLCLTMLTWVRFDRTRRFPFYILSLVFFGLSLASKTSIVMFPILLLVLGWWQHDRFVRKELFLSLPFFGLSLLMAGMTLFAQGRYFDALTNPLDGIYPLAGAGWVAWFSLYKTLLPINLSMIYPHWKEVIQSSGWAAFIPTVAWLMLFVVLWLKRRMWWGRPGLLAITYVTLMMFPVMGFFKMTFMRHSLVADHFLYAPIVGIIALGCSAWMKVIAKMKPSYRWFAGFAVVVLIFTLANLTFKRAHVLKSPQSLWQDTIAKNTGAWMAHYNLGVETSLRAEGRLREYQDMANDVQTFMDRTRTLKAFGKEDPANEKRQAAYGKKRQADALFRQARSGHLFAIKYYEKALDLQPLYTHSYNNLGLSLVRLGRLDEAIDVFRKGIDIDKKRHPLPKNQSVELGHNLGLALEEKGE